MVPAPCPPQGSGTIFTHWLNLLNASDFAIPYFLKRLAGQRSLPDSASNERYVLTVLQRVTAMYLSGPPPCHEYTALH